MPTSAELKVALVALLSDRPLDVLPLQALRRELELSLGLPVDGLVAKKAEIKALAIGFVQAKAAAGDVD